MLRICSFAATMRTSSRMNAFPNEFAKHTLTSNRQSASAHRADLLPDGFAGKSCWGTTGVCTVADNVIGGAVIIVSAIVLSASYRCRRIVQRVTGDRDHEVISGQSARISTVD